MTMILERLQEMYPKAETALCFSNPFELLVATILSAQTTDKQVNKVTLDLFAKYPDPFAFSQLAVEELAEDIKSIGLYRNKSKNIINTAQLILQKFGGQVPRTLEELITLPGVGRKTANVVLSVAFNIPAIAVDTHVFRVANRLGLAYSNNPWDTEEQLKINIPKENWSKAHHWLIWHGRLVCKARNPQCTSCQLSDLCPFFKENNQPHS